MHNKILNVLHNLVLRILVLNLSPPLMMKMNHRQTNNPLVYFVIPLVVLVHHLLQKQCLPLHLCICVRDEEVGVFVGKLQGRGWQIGLD